MEERRECNDIRMPFGIYNGKLLIDIPNKYLEGIMETPHAFPDDIVEAAIQIMCMRRKTR